MHLMWEYIYSNPQNLIYINKDYEVYKTGTWGLNMVTVKNWANEYSCIVWEAFKDNCLKIK